MGQKKDPELLDYFKVERKHVNPKNPREFYHHVDFDNAHAAILEGIRTRQGFMLLIGEAGLGKTLLLRRCMTESNDIHFILLGNANLDFPDILNYLCANLGLDGDEPDGDARNQQLLDTLAAYASRGQAVALLIDDAHGLRIETLLRLRDFVETSAVAVDQRLQVVLVGLPDIEEKLRQPELRPLQESIQVRCRLTPLNELETGLFIDHQFKAAGHAGDDPLSPAVVERIAYHSHGVPRAIVKLCDAVLLFASLQSERTITPAMVDEAAQNCFFGNQAELPGPVDVEPPPVSAAIAPPPIAEVSRRRWSPRALINGLTLAGIMAATVIWFWPAEQVAEDKPPPHHPLGPGEPVADLPDATPALPANAPDPAATLPAVPAPDSRESGEPAPEPQPLPPAGTVAAPLTSEPISTTHSQAGSRVKPKAAASRADPARPRSSGASSSPVRTKGRQASRIESQPRTAKPQKVAGFRKGARARRGQAYTVGYPWEKPAATGFNEK